MTTQHTDDLDLSRTVFEEGSDPRLMDANGTKHLIGKDAYGWLTIAHVEISGGVVEPIGDYPYTSFPSALKLITAIQEVA